MFTSLSRNKLALTAETDSLAGVVLDLLLDDVFILLSRIILAMIDNEGREVKHLF